MKVITPGHCYYLSNFEGTGNQILQFIHKENVESNLVTVANGTTNEEVISCLLDRLIFLNEKMPHPANDKAIECLTEAWGALNQRTVERQTRGVEGTSQL